MQVGLVRDETGCMWHAPRQELIVMRTTDGILHVSKADEATSETSDDLGQFVADRAQ